MSYCSASDGKWIYLSPGNKISPNGRFFGAQACGDFTSHRKEKHLKAKM